MKVPVEVKSHVDWCIFKQVLDAHRDEIEMRLPPPRLHPGEVVQHCLNVINIMREQGPHCFTIGYSADPAWRWRHGNGAYKLDRRSKWHKMILLLLTTDSVAAGYAEAATISHFKGTPGCWNHRLGGDSMHKQQGRTSPYASGLFACYVVVRDLNK